MPPQFSPHRGDVPHADGQMVRTCVSAAAGPIEIDL